MKAFTDRYAEDLGGADRLRALFSQLGVPPNLSFLKHGLELTVAASRWLCPALDSCAIRFHAHALPSGGLMAAAEEVLALLNTPGSAWDTTLLARMERPLVEEGHPLKGYCLSVLHLWTFLFYTPPPDRGPGTVEAEEGYPALAGEYLGYLAAAYSRVDPDRYADFCERWWADDSIPLQTGDSLFASTRIASRLATATLTMRRVTTDENRLFLSEMVSGEAGEPFRDRLRALLAKHDRPAAEQQMLRNLALLFEELIPGWKPKVPARSSDGATGDIRTGRGTRRAHLPDGYVRVAASDVVVEKMLMDDGTAIETYEVLRDDPNEDDGPNWAPIGDRTGVDLLEALLDTEPTDERAGDYPFRSRHAETHVRRAHLALPMSTHHLTQRDVQQIGTALVRELSITPIVEPIEHSLKLLLLGSLVTGRSLQQVVAMVSKREMTTSDARFDLASAAWRIPVQPPAWRDMPIANFERPLAPELVLPDLVGFAAALSAVVPTADCPFPVNNITTIRLKAVKEWLQKVTGDHHASILACQHWLFARVLKVCRGDIALATLITGRSHSHSGSVAHYAHVASERIDSAYRAAIAPLLEVLPPSVQTSVPTAKLSEAGLGARRVPTPSAVRDALSHLKAQLQSAGTPAERHNAGTAYVIAGLVLGVGLRPISVPSIADTDTSGRFITYRDKAPTDYHRRVSALPPVLSRQLALYTDHLRAIRVTQPADSVWQHHAFVWIDPASLVATPFQPARFSEVVGGSLMEAYALRRFIRSELMSAIAGLQGGHEAPSHEDIDAFMGHWHSRCSPHDKLSTYPLRRLGALADSIIEPLLLSLGYAPLRIGSQVAFP